MERFEQFTPDIIARLLENQRLYGEEEAHFSRFAIPLMRRVYPPLYPNVTPLKEKVNWKKEGF